MNVGAILIPCEPLPLSIRSGDAYARFSANPDLPAIPLVDGDRPAGLIERHLFLLHYARPYRRELYERRPAVHLVDTSALIFDCETPLEVASAQNRPAIATPASGSAVLDLELLQQNLGPIDERAQPTLQLFLSSTEPMIGALRRAAADHDAALVARTAHSIKGAAMTAGAMELGEVCAALERAAKIQDWTAVAGCEPALLPAFARLNEAVRRFTPTPSGFGRGEGEFDGRAFV